MKILIVVYDLRKKALAGSFRVMKFIEYFSSYGFDIRLVCAFPPDKGERVRDNVKIITVKDSRHENKLAKVLTRVFGLPDPETIWAHRALFNKDANSAAQDCDVVLVSSPPHGIQKVGLKFAKELGIPLVADLRDDFMSNDRFRWLTPIHRHFGKSLEKELVTYASSVVLNTDVVKGRFLSRYPKYSSKFFTITNGFSESDFGQLIKNPQSIRRVVYAGSAYGGYAPKMVSELAEYIYKKKEEDSTLKIEVHTAGPGDWSVSDSFDFWFHHGLLDQDSANQLVFDASSVILLMPPGEKEPSGTIPLKTYSYLRSGSSIIYYGEEGATTELLACFEGTYSLRRNEKEKFKEKVLEVTVSNGDFSKSREGEMRIYEMGSIAGEMADIIIESIRRA